jgi:hypothetical protein
MTDLNQFAEDLRQEVLLRASREDAEMPLGEAFTDYMIEELCSAGVLDDGETAPYRARGVEVSGYSLSDDGTELHLLVSVLKQIVPPPTVTNGEIETAIRRVSAYLGRAVADLAVSLEESTAAFDMTVAIRDAAPTLKKLRLIVITDGLAVLRERPQEDWAGLQVTTDVWDVRRLHQLATSGRPQEAIDIDFIAEFGQALPCLPAPQGHADYAAHLAIIPGAVLAEIYDRFGSRLLERNVRAFLQARGKVNSGIRKTILEEPERFLAYNNGISATAANVKIVRTADGGYGIATVSNLQIVIGGQTTASIHHLAKRDRERAKVDLSDIYVQAKLTIVPAEKLDQIVPLISLYANSQNKVNAADFEANSPFHVSVESLSRTVWAPALPGEPRMTHWFYERARGQYQDAVNREMTPARKREFKAQNPPRQKFTKTDLAKFENCWEQVPHIVGQGSEKNFRHFTLELDKRGKFVVDRPYFESLIAKAILYRRTEKIITQQALGAYRANTVAYTIAYVSHLTDRRLDLDQIWRSQDLSPALTEMIQGVCKQVREVLVDAPGNGNVTEWCKKPACWAEIRSLQIPLTPELESELVLARPETWRMTRMIVKALEESDHPLGKWDLIAAADIPDKAWPKLIGSLVSEGRVVKGGNTRASTYRLAPE